MGFWGDLVGSVGSIFGSVAPSVVGGLFGKEETDETNAMQMELADKQMKFQKNMANTAHRREVYDLHKAGLNPILSATGGNGAPSPGGAMAVLKNPADSVSDLVDAGANTAKGLASIALERSMARTEATKQNLNKAEEAKIHSDRLVNNKNVGILGEKLVQEKVNSAERLAEMELLKEKLGKGAQKFNFMLRRFFGKE